MRYLADSRRHEIKADHWYPSDLHVRAKVDEYLDSHHYHFRNKSSAYVFKKVHAPIVLGKTFTDKELENDVTRTKEALKLLEKRLAPYDYLASNEISIADIVALCDLDSLRFVDYNIDEKEYPRIVAWHKRVLDSQPAIKEVHEQFCKLIVKFKAA